MESTNRKVQIEKNKLGVIEKIGHRSSGQYFRVYEDTENKNFLKFEYEVKKNQKYHGLLVSKQFEKFEDSLCLDFIKEFGKLLPLQYSYVDWLVEELRKFRKVNKKLTESGMKTNYIVKKKFPTLDERKNFWNLLRFLNFIEELNYQTDSLGTTKYRFFQFPVRRFLEYTNESKNHHQLTKILDFFYELQANSMIQYFSKSHYRSLVTIPDVKLSVGKQNRWMAEVWVAEELFDCVYPFLFPHVFQQKLLKHEFEVVFYITQIFASEDLEKTFCIKDYFQNYPSRLSYSDKSKIKFFFIEMIEKLKKEDLIEDSYVIVKKGYSFKTKKLTPKNINEGFIICEKLEIKFPSVE